VPKTLLPTVSDIKLMVTPVKYAKVLPVSRALPRLRAI
jgi:hypothetical protein